MTETTEITAGITGDKTGKEMKGETIEEISLKEETSTPSILETYPSILVRRP